MGVENQMPSFTMPPSSSKYNITLCVEECITVPTFEALIQAFNLFLKDWYDWLTSASFPNVLYVSADDKFYYYEAGAFKDFVDFPNVFMKNGKLMYKSGVVVEVPASAIKNNVFYDGSQAEYMRVADGTAGGKAIYPYQNCVRYEPGTATWSYHNGTAWTAFSVKPSDGTLALQGGAVKMWSGSSFVAANLPYRVGDLRELSGKIRQLTSTGWQDFYFENQVRATADNKKLEVYRAGAWLPLHTITP